MAKLKELGELAGFLAKVITEADKALADGKLSIIETVTLSIGVLPEVTEAFKGLKNIPAELATATINDLNETVAFVASRLDLRNERTEQIAIKAVNMAIYAVDLVNTIKGRPQLVKGFGSALELVKPAPMEIDAEEDVIL